MDLLPDALLGPDAEVMVAGFPVGQIVGHHAPRAAGADDVENPIDDAAPGVFRRTTTLGHRGFDGEERVQDFPFGIGQAAWVTWHSKFLQYLSKTVQIKMNLLDLFQTAS